MPVPENAAAKAKRKAKAEEAKLKKQSVSAPVSPTHSTSVVITNLTAKSAARLTLQDKYAPLYQDAVPSIHKPETDPDAERRKKLYEGLVKTPTEAELEQKKLDAHKAKVYASNDNLFPAARPKTAPETTEQRMLTESLNDKNKRQVSSESSIKKKK